MADLNSSQHQETKLCRCSSLGAIWELPVQVSQASRAGKVQKLITMLMGGANGQVSNILQSTSPGNSALADVPKH